MEGGEGILQDTLKKSLLFAFRTGNVVVDTFITALVICISTYLIGLFVRIRPLIQY